MQVDYAVELGGDDATLEIPWADPGGSLRYYNLRTDPTALDLIPEAAHSTELRDFLRSVNSPASVVESAKCDLWASDEIQPEEQIFGVPWKFGSYVDLVFSAPDSRFDFAGHEDFLKELTALLNKAPDIAASAEFLLRRCYYHTDHEARDGFYVTAYVFGYGENEMKARQQWGVALELVGGAIIQVSKQHSAR
jgi:hypothetical protein